LAEKLGQKDIGTSRFVAFFCPNVSAIEIAAARKELDR
jgi:hypothetical protein